MRFSASPGARRAAVAARRSTDAGSHRVQQREFAGQEVTAPLRVRSRRWWVRYGTKPTLTFPKDREHRASGEGAVHGKGPVVVKNNLIVVDYLGQIWQGKVFDNSYDRKTPLGTPIGNGSVIKGWDTALVGKHVGIAF